MSYLLDTHAFLFAVFSPKKLSVRARDLLVDPHNDIFVSVVSFWEISLKYALGKLTLQGCLPEDLPHACRDMSFQTLALAADDAAGFHLLARAAHKDPFDRMLVWQAIRQNMILVSRDAALSHYQDLGLRLAW